MTIFIQKALYIYMSFSFFPIFIYNKHNYWLLMDKMSSKINERVCYGYVIFVSRTVNKWLFHLLNLTSCMLCIRILMFRTNKRTSKISYCIPNSTFIVSSRLVVYLFSQKVISRRITHSFNKQLYRFKVGLVRQEMNWHIYLRNF